MVNHIVSFVRGKREQLVFALIIFFGLAAYGSSFTVDFILDDYPSIVDNPFIKHLNIFVLWQHDPSRFLTQVTFAVNYWMGGLNVAGWHAVNFALHCASAFLVYLLTLQIFQTPKGRYVPERDQPKLAVATTLIFLLHPIQTQAVIYIVQRAVLLAAFFYFAALYFYVRARLTGVAQFYIYSLIAAYLAMLSKPLAATLPVMIAVYDIFFFGIDKVIDQRRCWVYFFLSLTILIIPLGLLGLPQLTFLAVTGICSLLPRPHGIPA